MSFSARVAVGTAVGLFPGVESAAYFVAQAAHSEKKPLLSTDQLQLAMGFPVAGAAAGAGVHAIRHLRGAPPLVQGAFVAITAAGLAGAAAYHGITR